ncbi:uncharacterized protein LY89DRAFT_230160 [Mollisia scopiformis]|uniref:Uncharacterized protein n=1 Tax=Mollisia scopiformis TaxID=149040 RepID=A0A194WUR1_MOLSC|nr:uncharacterized protein LY89DRAFT_230160 [Mollisia scopiformis]KUJ11701.1 hypothetical protein LY89DRAFT_230160 [Mollisia scopiformis]
MTLFTSIFRPIYKYFSKPKINATEKSSKKIEPEKPNKESDPGNKINTQPQPKPQPKPQTPKSKPLSWWASIKQKLGLGKKRENCNCRNESAEEGFARFKRWVENGGMFVNPDGTTPTIRVVHTPTTRVVHSCYHHRRAPRSRAWRFDDNVLVAAYGSGMFDEHRF